MATTTRLDWTIDTGDGRVVDANTIRDQLAMQRDAYAAAERYIEMLESLLPPHVVAQAKLMQGRS